MSLVRSLLVVVSLAAWVLPAFAQPAGGGPKVTGQAQPDAVRVEMLDLVDASRARRVPVALYAPTQPARQLRLAVLSHGYGAKHTEYSFIARYLATHGYVVASVQHEVPGDESTGTKAHLFVHIDIQRLVGDNPLQANVLIL